MVNAQHHGQRHHVHQNGRTSVAHERQRQALGRQGTQVHAHVDEGLKTDPDAHTLGHQAGEKPVQRNRLAADVDDAARQPHEQSQQGQHAQQAELFADHGQQEVGVRFRQPVEFFNAATQTDTEYFATTESDQRVRQLKTFAQGMFGVPGIQVGKNPLAAPVAQRHHQSKCDHDHRRDGKKHARVDAAQKENAHGDHRDHHESAHVGFGQQQDTDDGHSRRHRQHSAEKSLFDIHLAHHVVGCIEQDRELGQLGRLKVHEAQRDPAARTIDALADKGQQHQRQQHQRCDEQPGRHFFPNGQRHLKSQKRHHQSKAQRHRVPQQKMVVLVVRKLRVVRHRDRSRVHHDQAPDQQCQRDAHQRLVKAEQTHRGRGADAAHAGTHRQSIRVSRTGTEPGHQTISNAHSDTPASWARACTASQKTCARWP